ncbi:DNA-formamidopyrimidine glycosylase [Bacillus licheniformis]|uniref:Formamidopyrimidine-DNA glycosylase n=5 Tax=Bacillus subtilis group TaxID=653685 RepID=FPG_BACLD|nr:MULTISPECIES: DNA-formamidopyrimidine glycosylase [Bacillus]Q65G93.3 RecName: Full=Formamidopyrimidine-DNA glycosylase; Short=Fapy-DNA glycosylase; AltName: Full=DNA-(apurinic or apyrimidinic site) lyase MutM; Short=AP lyase MutM [Bacillus licheniformis DSM 13 = ATCC 14580]MBJ7886544.1 DNA-formamidopyrimidine glycosylase [Bacillaceae bacterium HSR45]MBY8347549.1 DNA-formamidopyrimidine glycosylase [Bacillus sp. PCH94]MDP4081276.1 DNA-formamidopyrimidine glycosylase [Bacillota bacterium]NBB4
MPELPEVETVRRTLAGLVRGKTIDAVDVRWTKIIKRPEEPEEFARLLAGQTIQSIGRRGKFLLFHLDDCVMVSHLRMEGKYGLHQNDEPLDKHVHVIFRFTDGSELRYRDVRKFGTMHLFKPGEELTELPLRQLGPEPFSSEFTADYLRERLKKTNRSVKTALLDQRTVVGLGNIYVDEALFRAGIHPEATANKLTKKQTVLLHKEIIQTLKEAVEAGGSTVRSYINSQGEIGMFQLKLFVYGRKDEPCKKCGSPIEKTVVGGRGTHFCIKCQKK